MDAEAYPQEILAEEEPKYLRRQKPLEIRRRKFGRKAWAGYLRASLWMLAALGCASGAWITGQFLIGSPEMALIHPEQVELAGNHFVERGSILEVFAADRGHSVLRIPLAERRRELEAIPWVEQATVRRALPNKIEVEITERTPIAFLRVGSGMQLIDVHGVILDPPVESDFHFPVVAGLGADMTAEDRERRMQLFAGFSQQVDAARSGAMDQVSVVDLSDGNDLRATITGMQGDTSYPSHSADGATADAPVLVHFGDGNFGDKYRTLAEKIGEWRATVGRVESVDLRFSQQAVVNPDLSAQAPLQGAPATTVAATSPAAAHSAKKAATRRSR
ncbi:MAG: FtsQ-type POTRA domain-containing protein [Candidatus Acidiferrales bacterium]